MSKTIRSQFLFLLDLCDVVSYTEKIIVALRVIIVALRDISDLCYNNVHHRYNMTTTDIMFTTRQTYYITEKHNTSAGVILNLRGL